MFYLLNSVSINPAHFNLRSDSYRIIPADNMNKFPNVLIPVANVKQLAESIDLLEKRRHYQYYHPTCVAYVLISSLREVWSLETAIEKAKEFTESLSVAKFCSWECEDYSRQIADLYSVAYRLSGSTLPKWGSAELVSFLHSFISNHDTHDYRSNGREFHVEKDHFYRFDKMSDFLNPEDVYEDGRFICWSTTKDRVGLRFFDTELEDLLREYIAILWAYRKTGSDSIFQQSVDATSSEELIASELHKRFTELLSRVSNADSISVLSEDEMSELATMITMHHDIYEMVCSELGIHFSK